MSKNILVVTPLQEEYDDLYNSLTAHGLKPAGGKIGKLPVHRFPDLRLTLARGGHGKTQFGIQTQHLLDHETFDLVICAGAAGALHPDVRVGDLIAATHTFEHDYNLKFAQRPNPQFEGHSKSIEQLQDPGLEAGFNIHVGVMASGDEDVIDVERGRELHKMSGALGVAWEGSAARGRANSAACRISNCAAQPTQPITKRR
ncbi:MAG: acyltransferase [Chloroflexi bacterium]|nr:acyltransferase [Chloroflexota bacterium]